MKQQEKSILGSGQIDISKKKNSSQANLKFYESKINKNL